MNSTKIILIAAALIIVAGLLYMFTTSNNTGNINETSELVDEEQIVEDDAIELDENVDVVVVNITGEDFSFDPSAINVKLGQTVRVVLTANDLPHDFVVDEFNAKSTVAQPGETIEVEFTPTQAGEFEYYCSVGEHRANGMVGTLTVTE